MRYTSAALTILSVCAISLGQDKSAPKWIWLDKNPKDNQTVYFRKVFDAPANLTAAKIAGTCDNEMTVYLDGKEVLKSSEWETPVSKDVLDILKSSKGKHVLAVQGLNTSGPAGLVLRLDLDARRGVSTSIVTNETWLVSEKADKNWQSPDFDDKSWKPAAVIANLGGGPWTGINDTTFGKGAKLKTPTATPIDKIKVAKDFRVELLYSVPKATQGSWVNMCVDPKGRLITSDQYGGLYRITPSAIGGNADETKVEKLPIPLGGAHGLLYAFDSLYVMVNEGVKHTLPDGKQVTPKHGLWRVRSKDGGETYGEPELLRELQAGGEHGAHAILLSPDGKSLYTIIGDAAKLTQVNSSRVPLIWGEDHLLPRMPDGNGFMKGVLAPGGYICKVDPDGKNWELISTGYRNEFDAAFNRQGELFTYDADMEWDFNTPWYRPTRVCLVTSGSEFGWRNGAGKWPPFYLDSLPAIYNVGPGSPTGMCFGYGAKFPAKYQDALFMCDWSYGKLYALHLTPDQSAYKAENEEFLNGTPLPLTDVVVNPKDGALYFTIGGRNTQSGLYRVTYVGKESTAEAKPDDAGAEMRSLRHRIESFHGHKDPKAVAEVWPYLSHPDRFIRFAARVALEWQDPKLWQDRALEDNEHTAIGALLALVRVSAADPFHRTKDTPPVDEALKHKIFRSLERISEPAGWADLNDEERLDLVRVFHVFFNRMGPPGDFEKPMIVTRLEAVYPTQNHWLNGELCALMVYLEAPKVVSKSLKLMREAPTQEEQIEYARSLRVLKKGWTPEQRKEYFSWFLKAANFRGGSSFGNFLKIIKDDATATLTAQEKAVLKPILEARPDPKLPFTVKQRPFVKNWTLDELVPIVEKGLVKRDYDRGRSLFGETGCFGCHRFSNEGGAAGHDLTGLGGRFSTRDLLEKITNPSKSISDQYAAVKIETTDGKTVVGRIVNLHNDNLSIQTDMRDPNALVNVDRKKIETMEQSKVSMMPTGLLDVLKEDEILDLIAYLLSRGDRKNAMFQK
jgi:putative heme-binding domain-containing protein